MEKNMRIGLCRSVLLFSLLAWLTGCTFQRPPPRPPETLLPPATAASTLGVAPTPAESVTITVNLSATSPLAITSSTFPAPAPSIPVTPTSTLTPASTPTLTPTPGSWTLSGDNIGSITQLRQWGKGDPTGLLWSPDGKWLVIGTWTGAYIYDAQTLVEQRFIDTQEMVLGMAISPDSRTLATGGLQLRLWDVGTGALVRSLPVSPDQKVVDLAFSPGGSLLAFLSQYKYADEPSAVLSVHQVGDGSLMYTQNEVLALGAINTGSNTGSMVFLNQGQVLGWRGFYRVFLLDAMTGEILPPFEFPIASNSVHPSDQVTLALVEDNGGYVLRDLESGEDKARFELAPTILPDLFLDPAGRRFVQLGDSPQIWEVSSGQVRHLLDQDRYYDQMAAFSPDGDQLALFDYRDRVFILLDTETGREARRLPWTASTTAVSFGEYDNRSVIAAGDKIGGVRLIDLENGALHYESRPTVEKINALALHPGGELLAISYMPGFEDTLQIIHLPTSQILFEQKKDVSEDGNAIAALAFSQDGSALLASYQEGQLAAWNLATSDELENPGAKLWYYAQTLEATWQGHLIGADWSSGDTFTIQDLFTGQVFMEAQELDSREKCDDWSVAISSDHRYLGWDCMDDVIPIWDLSVGKRVAQVEAPGLLFRNWLGEAVSFSPTGYLLVSIEEGGALNFWEPDFTKLLVAAFGHTRTIDNVHFTLDGRYLITFSDDGTLRQWGLPP